MELEVIGFDLASCAIAQSSGADRIELCANPQEGGTTPSHGVIAAARRATTVPLFPIIRPRGGDFRYSDPEFRAMIDDVRACADLGCDGVVIGMLRADGTVDTERCAELVRHAGGMQVTFHRAFDRVNDAMAALEQVIDLGCTRLLTSGLAPDVDRGRDLLRRLVAAAGDRIIVMPGSGVRSTNILEVARATGARAFHSSARTTRPSSMEFVNPAMQENLESVSIDGDEVAALRRILDSLAQR